jgi:hypothetical protein
MRVLLALTLLVAVASAGMKDEMEAVKMWAKMKALESCFGEDLVKAHLIKMKRAAAKCTGLDAPELDIPAFSSPYRVVSVLTSPPKDASDNFERLMSRYLQMQMLKQFGSESRFRRDADDDDDDDDMSTNDLDSVFDLGERLNAKLMEKKEDFTSKVGNITCILQELGIFDADKMFNPTKDDGHMADLDPYLKSHLESGCDGCTEFAKALPESLTKGCLYGPELAKAMFYKKCMMMVKFKTCMNFDIKRKLEKHFGPIPELEEKTGLDEDVLFEVVKAMLKGPESIMM